MNCITHHVPLVPRTGKLRCPMPYCVYRKPLERLEDRLERGEQPFPGFFNEDAATGSVREDSGAVRLSSRETGGS